MLRRVHLVERLVRDVRARGDLWDRQAREALLRDDRRRRVDDPFALALDDLLARQVVAPARQAPLRAPSASGRRCASRRRAILVVAACTRRVPSRPSGSVGGYAFAQLAELARELEQLLCAPLAQAHRRDLADPADQELRRQVGRVLRPRALARRLDHLLERLRRAVAPAERARTRAERAEQRERHRLRLGRRQLGEREQRQLEALLLRLALDIRLRDMRRRAPRDVLVGAQQQLFLVRVEVVEGRARDVRELRQIEDPHGRIAALRDQLDHRRAQPPALVELDLLARQAVRAGRQPAVSSCVRSWLLLAVLASRIFRLAGLGVDLTRRHIPIRSG